MSYNLKVDRTCLGGLRTQMCATLQVHICCPCCSLPTRGHQRHSSLQCRAMSAAVATAVACTQLLCIRWCCPIIATYRPRRCQLSLAPRCTRTQLYTRTLYTAPASVASHPTPTNTVSVPQLLAHLTALSSPSNPIRGAAFEHVSLALLSSLPLSVNLSHTGQSNDQGVDLLGLLSTPSATSPATLHRLVCQCKMEGRPTGAAALRGLEGTVGQYASGVDSSVIGMLVSAQPYTQQAEAQWRRSPLPLLLVSVDTQAAHAVAESEGVERKGISELQEALMRCLRRFSLNPVAAALLPHIRVVKHTLGTATPYIAVKQVH